MEAQYGKFLDMIRAVRINVPLIDVLAGMPNYGKFLKKIISNKHKIEQIYAAFLSDESSAMIQNKVPPKLGDLKSFLIPCNFNKTFSCNALANLDASINLMPYSLYAKLSLETLKRTKMSVRLADRSFQYPIKIAEIMLVEVGKFIFPANFVILEIEEDSKVPLVLGRPFLHTADAVIRVKQKQLNLGVTKTTNPWKEPSFLPVIISSQLFKEKKRKLISVLKNHKQAFAWKMTDIPGICPSFCKHKIQLLDDKKPVVQKQRRLNPNMQEVVKKEIVKLLDIDLRHLFKKQDAKPYLIRWILLLQEFDIEIKDRKGTENVAAGHLSRIENDETNDASEVDDNFSGETLMEINTKDEPWFADFANYLVVAVDYISKWAKAQALPTNDARVVVTFFKRLLCRFGIPKALISDQGTHLCNKIMEKPMKRYGVNHRFSTSYHPHTSGQVENTNRALKRILEKTVKDNPVIWSRKLDDALWAFRTAYKTSTGTTPYKLIYENNCHLPFKIEHRAYWALKNFNPYLIAAGEKRMF
ncbi:reverse transcriptase domain-containing protein [Tanacetum coccineum]